MVAFNPISNSKNSSVPAAHEAVKGGVPNSSFLNAFVSAIKTQRNDDQVNNPVQRNAANLPADRTSKGSGNAGKRNLAFTLDRTSPRGLSGRALSSAARTNERNVVDQSVHYQRRNDPFARAQQTPDSQATAQRDATDNRAEVTNAQRAQAGIRDANRAVRKEAGNDVNNDVNNDLNNDASNGVRNETTNTSDATPKVDTNAQSTDEVQDAVQDGTAQVSQGIITDVAIATASQEGTTDLPTDSQVQGTNSEATGISTGKTQSLSAEEEIDSTDKDLPQSATVDALVATLQAATTTAAASDVPADGTGAEATTTTVEGAGYSAHPLQLAALKEAAEAESANTVPTDTQPTVEGTTQETTGTPAQPATTDGTTGKEVATGIPTAQTAANKATPDSETTAVTPGLAAASPEATTDKAAVQTGQASQSEGTPKDSTALHSSSPTPARGVEGTSQVQATPTTVATAQTQQAAPTARPTMPTLTPQQQLANAIGALRRHGDGTHSATVELHPQELGSVRVDLQVIQGVVHVQLNAQEDSTRTLFLQNMDALRESLADAGLSSGNLDVGGQNDGPEQQESSGGGSGSRSDDIESEVQTSIPIPGNANNLINSGSGLDLKV